MNLEEIIKRDGLNSLIKSIFINLKGIDIDKVSYDAVLNSTNPISYLTSDLDGNWKFAHGSMTMIFKAVSKNKLTTTLNKLLLANEIDKKSSYKEDFSDKITFWNGKGFKIEKTLINEVNVIIITNADVIPSNATKLLSSSFAKKKVKPNWINGIDEIYDEKSIESENKNLNNFINVPLLFKDDEGLDYILINVQTYEIAKFLIDDIIDKNGGENIFKKVIDDKPKEWEYLFKGQLFVIGYLKATSVIRINRLPNTQKSLTNKKLPSGINKHSKEINNLVKGLNTTILNSSDGGVADGRFFTNSIDASLIIAFHRDANKFVEKFKDIVYQYNENDKIHNISNESIIEWLDNNPEEYIRLDVKNRFQLDLSKGNNLYRINIYPPGGVGNSWEFEKSNKSKLIIPNTKFSKKIQTQEIKYTSEIPIFPEKKLEKIDDEPNKIEKNKNDFLKRTKTIKEDFYSNPNRDNNGFSFRPFFIIIAIILLILILLKTCEDRDSNYYYERGNTQYDLGDTLSSLEYLEQAIDIDDSNQDALMMRGKIYLMMGMCDKAISDFKDVIFEDVNNWEAYLWRGKAYYCKGKNKYSIAYRKALLDFNKSIELEKYIDNAESYYYRGLTKVKRGGEKDGCNDFKQACDFDYNLACSEYNRVCYPETGYYPYESAFGKGVFRNNNNTFEIDNSRGSDDIVFLMINTRTNRKIRAQFVRKGDKYNVEKIPNGVYSFKIYEGDNWDYELQMTNDNAKGGFKNDSNFSIIDYRWTFSNGNTKNGLIFNAIDGDLSEDSINSDDFFN